MVGLRFLSGLLAAVGLVQASSHVPGAYILEFEDGADVNAELSSIQDVASTRMKLDFKLFKGASIQLLDTDTAEDSVKALGAKPTVKKMWPLRQGSLPKHTVHSTGNSADASGKLLKRQAANASDTFSPHVITQVNRLRDKGFVGKGIKVGIVDTGVDYRHEALGGCFGHGCLVTSGYDFVGDAFDGLTNLPVPDSDPFDCAGHGTHVAGIIAAQTNNMFGIVGAATGVTLGAYRIFGCEGATNDDVAIAAFSMAYEDGADVITSSYGQPSGWSENPVSLVVSRIVEMGIPCTIAVGNSGDVGPFNPSSPSDSRLATSVGSVENTVTLGLLPAASYTIDGGHEESFGYVSWVDGLAWPGVKLPLWSVGYDATDPANACTALPDDSPDLSGYLVLVRRGSCKFEVKMQNVLAKGAHYVIFYDNVAEPASEIPYNYELGVPGILAAAMVTDDQGAKWIAALAAGQNVTVAFTDPSTRPPYLVSYPNNLTGALMSTTSSWGPTWELDLKPQLAAPGGSILSTYPTALGSYAVFSGTSMSTPLVAAIYALLMEARGTKDAKTLLNLLSATSSPRLFNNGSATSPLLAPTAQQGAGLVQAYDAAMATSLLSVSSLSFNDTDHFLPVQNFTITNTGRTSVTYTLGHESAGTLYTLQGNSRGIYSVGFPTELLDDHATLEFPSGESLTLPAGQTGIVTVKATPPAGLDAERLPVYSGFVVIKGSDSCSLSLPYIGVAASLHSAPVIISNDTGLISSLDLSFIRASNHTFLLPPPGHSKDDRYASDNSTEFPALWVSFSVGTALMRIDVVPVSTNAKVSESLGLATIGDMYGTPLEYQPFYPNFEQWDGQLATGEYAPPGVYKLAVRALKLFGDRNSPQDYELFETVAFRIKYMAAP